MDLSMMVWWCKLCAHQKSVKKKKKIINNKNNCQKILASATEFKQHILMDQNWYRIGQYWQCHRSIPWLLMTWQWTEPGHQQPWYWLDTSHSQHHPISSPILTNPMLTGNMLPFQLSFGKSYTTTNSILISCHQQWISRTHFLSWTHRICPAWLRHTNFTRTLGKLLGYVISVTHGVWEAPYHIK